MLDGRTTIAKHTKAMAMLIGALFAIVMVIELLG
jgi:hypothetical protein